MVGVTSAIRRGREAFDRQAWAEAHALFAACADPEPGDLERLAVAAHLLGRDDESARAWELAHLARAGEGDHAGAARCAAWLGMALLLRGEVARASGWLARAERSATRAGRECAARGFLLVPTFLDAIGRGDTERAAELAGEIIAIAQRCGDPDLLALGTLSRGEALLAAGQIGDGTRLLDEVMVSVTTGEVSPIPAGIVYCAVIEACVDVFDLRRATEWTEALRAWCERQPDLVPYRGQCLVHRSQVLLANGAWAEAMAEAEHARTRLSDPAHPALGAALYQLGELHRLRGELVDAERAYRAAGELGREPVPGLALLRLAQGKVDAASAATRRAVDERRGEPGRPALLAAAVEILLAAGDVDGARAARDELVALAAAIDRPLLRAIAACATGSVRLAEGDATAALPELRAAAIAWRGLGVPYDEARARVLLALACRALGDHDAAGIELDAARAAFDRLRARPDVARVTALRDPGAAPRGLTPREREVLRLVATGRANKEIAADLAISGHTVARHLQNIFLKLGVSSRAAATAYAYEHDVV
jgi:DNA-binding CsgD family transcriptional regulator